MDSNDDFWTICPEVIETNTNRIQKGRDPL